MARVPVGVVTIGLGAIALRAPAPGDQDGRFTLPAPARNDYLAIALDDVEQGAWDDPEFLRRIRDRATPFTLGEGEARALTLTLISTSSTQQP
jgi:hypothetical protein